MNAFLKLSLAASLSLAVAGLAHAEDFTKGTVQKVDTKTQKVTIKHEDLKNLDMPGMTMVFSVADKSMLDKMKQGQSIKFVAERVKGKLTVVKVQ